MAPPSPSPQVKKTALREIRVLQQLKHENIVNLLQVFRHQSKICLVFEHIERTVLQEIDENPEGLEPTLLKSIMYQLLRAVHFIHSKGIIHRDIKPENLLLSSDGILKICDFGFARGFRRKEGLYTDYVSTRWYRSPELLVGEARYEQSVDIWSVGCIFAEMYNGLPLFPGESDLDTLHLIMSTVGQPLTS